MSGPVTENSLIKPTQSKITLDTRLKIVLKRYLSIVAVLAHLFRGLKSSKSFPIASYYNNQLET